MANGIISLDTNVIVNLACEDANPDIGDSSITETNGLGGFAIAASPARSARACSKPPRSRSSRLTRGWPELSNRFFPERALR